MSQKLWENCRRILLINSKVKRNCNSNKGSKKNLIKKKKLDLETLSAILTAMTTTSFF